MRPRIFGRMVLVVFATLLAGCRPEADESPAPTLPVPTPTTTPAVRLAPDLVPATPADVFRIRAASYYVQPILFVPADLSPDGYALAALDRTALEVQRWYAEQLGGRTFTLEPARMVRGTLPAKEYYAPCWPNVMTCDGGFSLEENIKNNLAAVGYPGRDDRVIMLAFQDEGRGGFAVGMHHLPMSNIGLLTNPDKLSVGGAALLLGYSLGIPPTTDVNGESGISVLGYGMYAYPRAAFVESAANPERSMLRLSPFINYNMPLADGGFEECSTGWTVQSGAVSCTTDGTQHSGLSALRVKTEPGQTASISHAVTLKPGGSYDLTGWVNSIKGRVSVSMRAWDSEGTLIEEAILALRTPAPRTWEKIGGIYRIPAGGSKFEMTIALDSGGTVMYLDDFAVVESISAPGVILPMAKNSGETVAGTEPVLEWFDIVNAPVYQVQLDTDWEFKDPIMDQMVSTPSLPVEKGLLDIGSTYSWRVRAGNGAGWGEWSPIWQFATRPEGEYTGDEFPAGKQKLDSGWSWIRENPSTRGFNGYPSTPGNGYLSIDIRGGGLAGPANPAQNLLVRTPQAGDWMIDSLVEIWGLLSPAGQEAGMMLYQDDDNYCKLGRILSPEGYLLQWGCEFNGQLTIYDTAWAQGGYPIRIRRTGNTYAAFYSINGLEWHPMETPVSLDWENWKIGLYAYGPIGSREPTSAHFDYFRYAFPSYMILQSE